MNEDAARAWLLEKANVSRETLKTLEVLVQGVVKENASQNLIAASTIPSIWSRHIVDSAQLVPLAAAHPGLWVDLGSGAGFPGLVVAALRDSPLIMIESRRRRAEHLLAMTAALDLTNTRVILDQVERVREPIGSVISARAFAPLDRLFRTALHLSSLKTLWLLPKGKNALSELEEARRSWQGVFRIVPSVTDPDGAIIVATEIRPKG